MRRTTGVVAVVALLVGCSSAADDLAADPPESATTLAANSTDGSRGSVPEVTPLPDTTPVADTTRVPDITSVSAAPETTGPDPWFVERFDAPDGLLTNEFAYRNSTLPDIVSSSSWDVTSGSLSIRDGAGWTGIPDRLPSEPRSELGNGSAVFRALAATEVAGDVSATMRLRVVEYVDDSTSENWDGAHVLLRYEDEARLYAVSVARRDGTLAIKRKLPGGDANDGRYLTLSTGTSPVQIGRWHIVTTTVADVPGGVEINLWIDGELAISAVDLGQEGGVITGPGVVGLRGDNVELEFDDLIITPLEEMIRERKEPQVCDLGLLCGA